MVYHAKIIAQRQHINIQTRENCSFIQQNCVKDSKWTAKMNLPSWICQNGGVAAATHLRPKPEATWKRGLRATKFPVNFKNIGMLRMQELFFLGEGTLKPLFVQFRPPPPLISKRYCKKRFILRYATIPERGWGTSKMCGTTKISMCCTSCMDEEKWKAITKRNI